MRAQVGAIVALFAMLPALAFLDYLSGPDFGFSIFYLIPVGIAAWRIAGPTSIVLAVASAGCWVTADAAYHGLTAVAAWNGFTRLTMYVTLAVLARRVRRNRDDLDALNRQLAALLRQEQALARTDSLTGLANRRSFEDALQAALARNRRAGSPIAVGLFDLDHFKRLNDTQGHAVGDAALREVAAALSSVVRGGDVAARFGGDEFAVLFHECDHAAAQTVGRRILETIRAALERFQLRGLDVSGGVACFERVPEDTGSMIAEADGALYEAKSAGKGCLAIRPRTALPAS
jgi:diguanylate cyclase (GGDEF)-like protein